MIAEEILYNLLANDSNISAVAGGRIYPSILPQSPQFPAITYFRVSALRDRTMNGPSGLVRPRIQVDVWALKYKDAKNLANLIENKLDGLTFGDVQDINLDNEQDMYEVGENLIKAYRVSMDFIVYKSY